MRSEKEIRDKIKEIEKRIEVSSLDSFLYSRELSAQDTTLRWVLEEEDVL